MVSSLKKYLLGTLFYLSIMSLSFYFVYRVTESLDRVVVKLEKIINKVPVQLLPKVKNGS